MIMTCNGRYTVGYFYDGKVWRCRKCHLTREEEEA